MKLVLASSSVFRKELLERLQLEFVCDSPDIDESQHQGETVHQYVQRLSVEKSQALKSKYPNALLIGSDQILLTQDSKVQGKPMTHQRAMEQLKDVQGTKGTLLTGLAVYNSNTQNTQFELVEYEIGYRNLTDEQIEHYLKVEKPYNCAGAIKSEGLGTSLLTYLRGDDPTAIIGLPLIKLTDMLMAEGVAVI